MIVTEYVVIDNRDFTRKYSDENRYLVDDFGGEYEEAYDLIEYPKHYVEGREIEYDILEQDKEPNDGILQ